MLKKERHQSIVTLTTTGAKVRSMVEKSVPTRVLLADDHDIVRQALQMLLQSRGDIEIVGDVRNGREAVTAVERLRPDVVLMDLVMPGLNGIEATRQIRRIAPRTQVLMLSGYVDERQLLEAVRAGAAGFLIKTSDINELLLAIDSAKRGNRYFSSKLNESFDVDELLQQSRRGAAPSGPGDRLTVREREVLQLVAEGYTNQGIADALVVSVKTVEAHKSHLQQKLRARNRADLIRYAIASGLVTLETVDDGFSALGEAEAG